MFISVLCSSAHPNSHAQSPDSDGEFVFDLHNCTQKSLPASELSKKLISHAKSLILFPLSCQVSAQMPHDNICSCDITAHMKMLKTAGRRLSYQ